MFPSIAKIKMYILQANRQESNFFKAKLRKCTIIFVQILNLYKTNGDLKNGLSSTHEYKKIKVLKVDFSYSIIL